MGLRNLPHSYSSIVYLIITKNFCIQALQKPSWSGIHLFFFFFFFLLIVGWRFFFFGKGLSIIIECAVHHMMIYIKYVANDGTVSYLMLLNSTFHLRVHTIE